jgi:hypothetical protein
MANLDMPCRLAVRLHGFVDHYEALSRWWASAPSRVTVLVAAAALGSKQGGQGVHRGAGIGVGIKALAALGAETAPVADQQRSAEQVGPDFHPIEPAFVRFRTDANEGGGFRKERKLDGSGAFRAKFTASGH